MELGTTNWFCQITNLVVVSCFEFWLLVWAWYVLCHTCCIQSNFRAPTWPTLEQISPPRGKISPPCTNMQLRPFHQRMRADDHRMRDKRRRFRHQLF